MTWKLNKREIVIPSQITKKILLWLITFFFQASESENFIEKMTCPPLFKLNGSSLCSLVGLNTCNCFVIQFLLWLKIKLNEEKMWKLCQFDLESWRHHWYTGTCKMRNEIETKRNLPTRNEIETKRNKTVSFR